MKKTFSFWLFVLLSGSTFAETELMVFTGISQVSFDLREDRGVDGIDISDDFSTTRLGFSAYRVVSDTSAWGFVIEIEKAFSRDFDQGSGRILGVRPINWKYNWTQHQSTQVFFGAARYEWEEGATGYYAGASYDYKLTSLPIVISAEAKYYYDINYDTNNNDLFISGPAFGFNLGYRF